MLYKFFMTRNSYFKITGMEKETVGAKS